MCRVGSSSGTQEASVLVTIQQRLGPSHREYLRGYSKQWGLPRFLHPQWLPHPASRLTLPAQSVVYPVRIESSSASLANGHTLDLNCLVASQAPHTITWYKRGGSLPSRHQVPANEQGGQKLGTLVHGSREELSAPPLCSFSHSANTECSC